MVSLKSRRKWWIDKLSLKCIFNIMHYTIIDLKIMSQYNTRISCNEKSDIKIKYFMFCNVLRIRCVRDGSKSISCCSGCRVPEQGSLVATHLLHDGC